MPPEQGQCPAAAPGAGCRQCQAAFQLCSWDSTGACSAFHRALLELAVVSASEKQWDGVPKSPRCCQCPCPAHSSMSSRCWPPVPVCCAVPALRSRVWPWLLGREGHTARVLRLQRVQPEEGFGSSVLAVVWHCPVPAL